MERHEHPVLKGYHASADGAVFGVKGRILSGYKQNGKVKIEIGRSVRADSKRQGISTFAHIFVYECFHGAVDCNAHVIKHSDGNLLNNAVSNLQLVTKFEYYKTSGRKRTREAACPTIPTDTHNKEHPVHKGYYASKTGTILGKHNRMMTGSSHLGYRRIEVNDISKFVHVFVYECFHGLVDSSVYDIDHTVTRATTRLPTSRR